MQNANGNVASSFDLKKEIQNQFYSASKALKEPQKVGLLGRILTKMLL